jgi:D-xylose transport system substrate-binding protein
MNTAQRRVVEGFNMELLTQHKTVFYKFIGSLTFCALLLTSCSIGGSNNSQASGSSTPGGKNCTKVGIFLPDTASSNRYETKDHPLLVKAIKAAIPNVQIDYHNAQGDASRQLQEAVDGMNSGDCILVVDPQEGVQAASIANDAKARNIPIISYDRLIQSKNTSYYVSFDNVAVGALQGDYIVDNYQAYATTTPVNIDIISGSQTDSNALMFSQGLHEVLDPYFARGIFHYVNETFTPNYSSALAQSEAMAALANTSVQIFYVANDGMADGVINELQAKGLDKRVLVTGQDATVTGIRHILLGEQNMTVYKPIEQEANSVGDLIKAIYNGTPIHYSTVTTADGGNIPAILDKPISVTINNIKSTVLADNFVTKAEICQGIPAGTGGIC